MSENKIPFVGKVEKITKKEYSSVKVRAKRDPNGYLLNYKSVPNTDDNTYFFDV